MKNPQYNVRLLRVVPQLQPWLEYDIEGNTVQFFTPIFGPANYRDAGSLILKAGLEVPTGKEIAFFMDECYNSANPEVANSPEAQNIRAKMNSNWFWDFKKNRYTSKGPEREKGIWVVRDTRAIGLSEQVDMNGLAAKLSGEVEGVKHSKDWAVSFVPESTYLGKPFDSKNGYLIARGEGKEGAEALLRVSKNKAFRNKGEVYLSTIQDSDFEKVSALGGYGGSGLSVNGSDWNDDGNGFAVGVKRAPQKI